MRFVTVFMSIRGFSCFDLQYWVLVLEGIAIGLEVPIVEY
jgi:hypothetical protein